VAFWIVVGALVITAVWSIATGTYFAFRDNVLTRLIGRQTELEFAYEDRIAQPRAQVDRIMSRQLFDQEQFKKINTLLQRTATLTGDPSTTGTIKPARTVPAATKLERLGGGSVVRNRNVNSNTMSTVSAAIRSLLMRTDYITRECLACEFVPKICWLRAPTR
jgi:hypothetical protein